MVKIPVNIITVFLGSGKTTSIIQLLRQKPSDECWVIVVNEFGKVSIDGQTLRSKSDNGSVFDISGGCICCSAQGYFKENLERIILSDNFDRIIIEISGLGGIEIVTAIVETFPNLRLMPLICMVDITGIENQRLQRTLIYQNQIHSADLIIFSKCDLLDDVDFQKQLVEKFKSIFSEKHFFMNGNELSPSVLHSDYFQQNGKGNSWMFLPSGQVPKGHNYLEKNYQFGPDIIFDSEKLKGFFSENPSIIRAKGYLLTENGWNLFNYTLAGCIFEACQAKNQNELVIIAKNPDFEHFIADKMLFKN